MQYDFGRPLETTNIRCFFPLLRARTSSKRRRFPFLQAVESSEGKFFFVHDVELLLPVRLPCHPHTDTPARNSLSASASSCRHLPPLKTFSGSASEPMTHPHVSHRSYSFSRRVPSIAASIRGFCPTSFLPPRCRRLSVCRRFPLSLKRTSAKPLRRSQCTGSDHDGRAPFASVSVLST